MKKTKSKKIMKTIFMIGFIFLLSGCGSQSKNQVYQVSTIVNLMKGDYLGKITCRELKRHGNFGVGTVKNLDGEVVILDGKASQLKADGKVYPAKGSLQSPFAMVTSFKVNKPILVKEPLEFKQFIEYLDTLIDTQNAVTAIKLEGIFTNLKIRVVPVQQEPFLPLAEVIKNQQILELKDVQGTLLGFYLPRSLAGINTPGYHFHFISKDGQGGHVVEVFVLRGKLLLDAKEKFYLDFSGNKNLKNLKEKKTVNKEEARKEENSKEAKVTANVEKPAEKIEEKLNAQQNNVLEQPAPEENKAPVAPQPETAQPQQQESTATTSALPETNIDKL